MLDGPLRPGDRDERGDAEKTHQRGRDDAVETRAAHRSQSHGAEQRSDHRESRGLEEWQPDRDYGGCERLARGQRGYRGEQRGTRVTGRVRRGPTRPAL
jgi:hypothetical protein